MGGGGYVPNDLDVLAELRTAFDGVGCNENILPRDRPPCYIHLDGEKKG